MEQGEEVLFYRTDLYEEHLGKTQLRDVVPHRRHQTIGLVIFLK